MEGTYKGLSQKEIAGEVPVSAEEIEIYNKVNQACSSRLPPEIKKEKVVVDEKIGQSELIKRNCVGERLVVKVLKIAVNQKMVRQF
ncbi:uncharacterized protein OCT59_029169 [Rhizophagus irregularis]|uniref:uncharacterized protein n=1 Tax=Rhizophagus irregularis TaxID=588596 RepID=UPI003326E6FE|nr:hypothetical protein OCT59_029169 [Rhizophagus irregularis]